jgi:hypothetical protein
VDKRDDRLLQLAEEIVELFDGKSALVLIEAYVIRFLVRLIVACKFAVGGGDLSGPPFLCAAISANSSSFPNCCIIP